MKELIPKRGIQYQVLMQQLCYSRLCHHNSSNWMAKSLNKPASWTRHLVDVGCIYTYVQVHINVFNVNIAIKNSTTINNKYKTEKRITSKATDITNDPNVSYNCIWRKNMTWFLFSLDNQKWWFLWRYRVIILIKVVLKADITAIFMHTKTKVMPKAIQAMSKGKQD